MLQLKLGQCETSAINQRIFMLLFNQWWPANQYRRAQLDVKNGQEEVSLTRNSDASITLEWATSS